MNIFVKKSPLNFSRFSYSETYYSRVCASFCVSVTWFCREFSSASNELFSSSEILVEAEISGSDRTLVKIAKNGDFLHFEGPYLANGWA